MPTKQIILIVLLATILPSIVAVNHIYSMAPAERWLFMMKSDATRYAEAMLSGDTAMQDRYAREFKGYEVVANPKGKTVLFSSRDGDGGFSLVYAPNETSDWISYEQSGAKRIKERWYVLAQ